jgi:hypothetical protein
MDRLYSIGTYLLIVICNYQYLFRVSYRRMDKQEANCVPSMAILFENFEQLTVLTLQMQLLAECK